MNRNYRKDCFMIITMMIVICIAILGGCTMLNKKLMQKDDNAVEELIEELIESKTGLDLDLTPCTPED